MLAIAAAIAGYGGASGRAAPMTGCDTRHVAQLPHARTLHGDVDGDGNPDAAFVVTDFKQAYRCRFWLVVRRRGGIDVGAVRSSGLPGERFMLKMNGLPELVALADVAKKPGLELIVRVGQGASASSAAVFTERDHHLIRMLIKGYPKMVGSTFVYNLGDPLVGGVDCIGGRGSGRVLQVRGGADANGLRWEVEEYVFDVRGNNFVYLKTVKKYFKGTFQALIKQIPAARGEAFPSCRIRAR